MTYDTWFFCDVCGKGYSPREVTCGDRPEDGMCDECSETLAGGLMSQCLFCLKDGADELRLCDLHRKVFAAEKTLIHPGDVNTRVRFMGALRTLRSAAHALLAKRYTDGECDAVALAEFAEALLIAEESLAQD